MITVNTVSEYVSMNEKRRSVLSVLAGGIWSFYVGGEWIGEDEFNRLYPVAEYKKMGNIYGDNPDKRKAFVVNKKSY